MDAVITQLNSIGRSFVIFALPMLIQSSLLILILLGLNLMLRRKPRAVFRYWLLLLILVKLVLPTTLSAPTGIGYWVGGNFLNLPSQTAISWDQPVAEGGPAGILPVFTPAEPPDVAVAPIHVEPITEMPDQEVLPAPRPVEPVPEVLPPAIPITWTAIALLIWLAVVAAMVLLLIQRLLFVRGLIAQSSDADAPLLALLEDCRNRLAIKKSISLKISPNATSPAVCGLFRPMILIPQHMPEQLDSQHLSAVLLHELAHIKRRDLWVNLAQTLLQIVYFYNPLLWLANAVIRRVREQAVDEMVLVAMGEKHEQYPDTLLAVARLSLARPALSLRLIGVVESKKALTQRIKHIISRPLPKTAKLGLLGLAIVLITAALLLPMAKGESKEAVIMVREGPATQPGKNVAAEVHYTFDTDAGLDIVHSEEGMNVGVQIGELRVWGKTTDTEWGGEGTFVPVNDLGGSLDASIDFKLPKREDYGLVFMGLYPEGQTGRPMILYQWQLHRPMLWFMGSGGPKGWYQVHTMWLKVKWWLEKGRRTYPDVGKEDTEFITMRMYVRENRKQIDYYVNDVLVDTLNLEEPLGRVNKAIVAFQTPKAGYEYDIRFDNLKISSAPRAKSASTESPQPATKVADDAKQEIFGVSPERAVVIDPKLLWNSVGWAGSWGRWLNTEAVAMDVSGAHPRFSVIEPEHWHVWIYYFTVPIDPEHYPIVVLTYRARNAPSVGDYVLWLDDTRGPNSGGVAPFSCSSLTADGKIHRLKKDLRELGPEGHITGMALGVFCGKQTPGEFELIGLRFEAPEDAESREPIPEDNPISIRAVDSDGKPVEGATVVVDPEQINWSRSAITGKDGRARLTPLANVSGRHMLRISKQGLATVETGGRRFAGPLPEQVTLRAAVRYGGLVKNQQGQPVEGAAVAVHIAGPWPPGIRQVRSVNVLTDSKGRWHTPPLPDNLDLSHIGLSHPDYISDSYYGSSEVPPMEKLRDRTAVMILRRGLEVVGQVLDTEGKPVGGASVRQGRDRRRAAFSQTSTDERGHFRLANARPGEAILTAQKAGFAPELLNVQVHQDMEPLRFVLEKGQTIRGRVVDTQDRPIADVRVMAISWRNYRTISWSTNTNPQGQFSWTDAPADEVCFYISKPDYVWISVNLAPSENEQVVTLTESLRLMRSLRSMRSFIADLSTPERAK